MISSAENARFRPSTPSGGPYLDYGPDLPSRYGVRVIRIVARDPWCVFAYWEASGGVGIRLRNAQGLVHIGRCLEVGTWYFAAMPDCEYQADVVDRGGAVLATSNHVRTPRGRPATLTDHPLSLGERDVLTKLAGQLDFRPSVRIPGYGSVSHT